ncbi:unnamed protein product [Leuciscus chuanchicus]
MSSAGVGPLCFLRSKVNAAVYEEVLEHFMLPAAVQLYGDADLIFQQDLAPSHSAKATSTWFKDHGIPVLNWPANLPDLNPIENLWGIVKKKMRYARPNNAEELKATIRATWALITPEQCHRLIDSMPRCIAAVKTIKVGVFEIQLQAQYRENKNNTSQTFISMWAFILCFICAEVCGETDDIETVQVKEGGFLNLHPGLHDLNGDVQILWTFESGRQSTRVAQMYQGKIYTHYDKRLTGRVQLDRDTGILTISDIRTNESGLYKAVIIVNTHISGWRYKVDVYAPVSVPAIRSSSAVIVHTSTGASEEICSVFCSVRNDRDVSISWYKGSEMMNQTSNPDLSIILSLPLELHYNDSEIYSCMTANPVSNKSVCLHMKEICTRHEDCLDHCCGAEALIRLVLSGLVGIATVVFLVDHVRICSEKRRAAASV